MVAHIIIATRRNCSNPARTDLLMKSDHKPKKLGQSDLVYWVYRSSSSCQLSVVAHWLLFTAGYLGRSLGQESQDCGSVGLQGHIPP